MGVKEMAGHTASEAPAEPPATSSLEDAVKGGEWEAAQLTALIPDATMVSMLCVGPSG
jgi:hypothetical protein